MRLAILFLLALLTVAAPGARAQEAGDIPAVIEDQIAAFGRDDLAAAFAHASPAIQGRFRDPETFGRMVETGYPMVWRPGRWEMRGLAETPRGPVQTVLFEDRAGRLWEADYLMQAVDGRWRINGVSLREVPGVGS